MEHFNHMVDPAFDIENYNQKRIKLLNNKKNPFKKEKISKPQ